VKAPENIGDLARFSAFGLPVVEDRLDGYSGPLAGIEAGIEWARANGPKCCFAITAASDTPFLSIDLVRRSSAAIDEDSPKLDVAQSEGGLHPVFGLWPISLATDLKNSLKAGVRKASE
jgi:molybdopterin-guanine dinucleotide biosynthesis protein A